MERLADNALDRAHTRFIVSDDPQEIADKIQPYVDLGFTELVFHFPGNDQRRYIDEFAADVFPLLRNDRFETLDERFGACVKAAARLDHLYEGCRWAEGPAYFPAHRALVWSDIPNDRMLRYDEATGNVGVFREPAGYTNGHTVDAQGRLVSCEHGNRRVTRTEHDGTITVLADRFDGKRLNSPNDVVVRSDGAIYFTDPAYGIESDYEGYKGHSEIGGLPRLPDRPEHRRAEHRRRRLRPPERARVLPRRARLYVSDTGAPKHMRVLDVADDGSLSTAASFAKCTVGGFDGFRLDDAGRIWTSAGDGVHCYDPDGTLLGKVLVPEGVANVAWGGRSATASTSARRLRCTRSCFRSTERRRCSHDRPPRPLPDAAAGRSGGPARRCREDDEGRAAARTASCARRCWRSPRGCSTSATGTRPGG